MENYLARRVSAPTMFHGWYFETSTRAKLRLLLQLRKFSRSFISAPAFYWQNTQLCGFIELQERLKAQNKNCVCGWHHIRTENNATLLFFCLALTETKPNSTAKESFTRILSDDGTTVFFNTAFKSFRGKSATNANRRLDHLNSMSVNRNFSTERAAKSLEKQSGTSVYSLPPR